MGQMGSPYSYAGRLIVQNYGGNTAVAWETFIADLEKLPPEFRVLGINDYIFVDGYERVLKAKREEGRLRNIDLILPVIELRLDKFAGVVKKSNDGYSKVGLATASTCTSSLTNSTLKSYDSNFLTHYRPVTS